VNGRRNPLGNPVFRQLVYRGIRSDYLENLTGFAWLILQPLLLLAVYAFVFTTIFKARVPDGGAVGFVPFLAVAFWPWTAFSESVLRASSAVTANAALIGKVAFPSELLPLSTVAATFLMNVVGFAVVLLVLQLLGTSVAWAGLLGALPLLLLLWLFAGAIALLASALQVFVRDVAQMLPPLMTFWFFTTPILYSVESVPPALAAAMRYNPMAWFTGRLRDFLLYADYGLRFEDAVGAFLTVALFALSLFFFRRLSTHFEDFL
jgi:ABC-type polysaccharide/polyol phosphate export permease